MFLYINTILYTETENVLPTLPCLTAAAALKGKQVGVIAVASQAEIRPPDGVSFACVKNELSLGELHDPRAQLVAFIININDLKDGETQ